MGPSGVWDASISVNMLGNMRVRIRNNNMEHLRSTDPRLMSVTNNNAAFSFYLNNLLITARAIIFYWLYPRRSATG